MSRSTIGTSLTVALLLGMVSVTGCGNNDAAGTNQVHTNNVRGVQDGRLKVNTVPGRVNGTHNFDKLEMSQDLADRIAAMQEVRSANVLLAGKSAYIAVTLDEAGSGTHDGSAANYRTRSLPSGNRTGNGTGAASDLGAPMKKGMDRTLTGMDRTMSGIGGALTGGGKALTGTDRTTAGTGTNARTGGATVGTGSGMTGTGAMTGTAGGSGVAGNMGTGNIGTGTGRGIGAYGTGTGTALNTDDDSLSMDIKNKVAAEVKKWAPEINAVYVSANPDFVQRVNGYADQARGGYPLQGFVNEFRTMVERIFPARSDVNR